jgi:type IV fimbrial biogenesis protein FimT
MPVWISPSLRRRIARGMSSMEWLVVLAIAAILLSLGSPVLLGLLEGQRVNTQASALANDLHFARTESVKRGHSVTVCISSDGGRCMINGSAWQAGWIVFVDRDGDQSVGAGEPVLRTQRPWTSTDSFTNHRTAALTYNREGFVQNTNQVVMLKLQTATANAASLRCLVANRFGQQRVLTVGKSAYGKTCL